MRQSIAGTWLLGIVLVFMTVFISYISISINYNHAFQLKTDIVQTVEEYQGINETSLDKIDRLMSAASYGALGSCKSEEYPQTLGVRGTTIKKTTQNLPLTEKYNYCVYLDKKKNGYYYTIEVFLKFNLPVLGDLLDFRILGETNAIKYPYEKHFNLSLT